MSHPDNANDDRWGCCPPLLDLQFGGIRPSPSAFHRELVLNYIGQQLLQPGALQEWIEIRMENYAATTRWDDWEVAYSACRDLACWQLRLGEAMMLVYLEGLREYTAQ